MDLYRFNLRRILGPFLLLLILTGCNSINARNEVDEPLVIEAVETPKTPKPRKYDLFWLFRRELN